MAIKSITEKSRGKIEIDLTGPDGNAFVLMGIARDLAIQLGLNKNLILAEMKSSDYEHLLQVMEKYFGSFIIMYR